MSTHKHIDRIALLIILTVLAGVLILFAGMGASGERSGMEKEYETGLFSTDQVHTIEITMDDWEDFLEDCENEEYVMCDVTIDGQTVTVKGPKGELTRTFLPSMTITRDGDELIVTRPDDTRESKSAHGLTRTLLANMVEGVSNGFSKKLQLVGVGYRAALKGKDLEMQLGYSHPVLVEAPENITFEVPSQTEIVVSGPSKEQVGQVAANIRKWRKPEPYKGKGIRYEGEHVRRKAGKAGKD